MSPDRVTPENLLYVVGQLVRDVEHLQQRTEDLNVISEAVTRCNDGVHSIRKTVDGVRMTLPTYATKTDVDDLRNALNRAAIAFAGSAIIFALTIWAVFK